MDKKMVFKWMAFLFLLYLIIGISVPIDSKAADDKVKEYIKTASALLLQRNYQKALFYFKKALEIEPNNSQVNSGIGNTYAAMKRYQEAIPHLEKAIEINPNDDTAYFGLGACYLDLYQHQKAMPYLKKSVKIRPDNKKAQEALAIAYVRSAVDYSKMQQNKKAKEFIKSAIEIFERIGNNYRANELGEMLKEIPD